MATGARAFPEIPQTPGERGLREGAAVVYPLARAIYLLSGERPLSYLHDVLAQDVEGVATGRGAIAAVLDAKGHLAAELRVVPVPEGVLVDAEPEARAGIEEHIGRHAPLAGCALTDVSGAYEVAAIRGPGSDHAIEEAGLPVPPAGEASIAVAAGVVVVRVVWGVSGVDLIGSPDAVRSVCARVPADPASADELDAARIETGRPRFGTDMSDELMVNETPLLAHGVSMTKGCYPGQESVARVHNLGRARRALRGLRSPAAIAPGAEVCLNGTIVGRVTSAAGLRGGAAAIAILRSEISPGTAVRAGESEAIVTELS